MAKNIKLLQDTLQFIKMNPQLHDQGDWVQVDEDNLETCDTPMCFAGHAALLSGGTFDKEIWEEEWDWNVDYDTGKHVSYYAENGAHVSTFAADRLGLNEEERVYLFAGTRSGEELEEAVQKFSEGYTVDFDGNFVKEKN